MRVRVIVENLYTEQKNVIEGTVSQVEDKLIEQYPWLASCDPEHAGDIKGLVEQLDSAQAYHAWIDSEDLSKSASGFHDADLDDADEVAANMAGFNPQVHPAFAAAQFLSGKPEVSLQAIRQALYEHEDYIDAAARAYGLPEGDESRRAIRAVMGMSEPSQKVAQEARVPAGEHIEPGTSDANSTVEALRRAWRIGAVRAVHLAGKHSAGALIAHGGNCLYLLKPGSGAQVAAGAAQEHASQSRREVAFWQIADDWGLGSTVPRCDLVIIDGTEYAAIVMLPFSWQGMQQKFAGNPNIARQALSTYRDLGMLHKWAVIDFVLGNPDRHADNMMISGDNRRIALIDHGSAFAGPEFDPAYDRNSFVPYYLRVWAGPKFNRLTVKEKLERMPTVNRQLRSELQGWLNRIDVHRLEALMNRFGIDPRPSLDRFDRVKAAAGSKPVDLAVMTLWVTT
jgi:hypothetical protein